MSSERLLTEAAIAASLEKMIWRRATTTFALYMANSLIATVSDHPTEPRHPVMTYREGTN